MKRYEMSTQISQISHCTLEEDIEEIDAMELRPRDNSKRVFHGNDRGNRNFGPIERDSFGKGSQNGSQDRRQNFKNNSRGVGRGSYNQEQSKLFRSQYQDGSKPANWDATFQAYDIDSKSLLEALKKLATLNPNLKGKFNPNVKQEMNKKVIKEDKAMAKEITEAFFLLLQGKRFLKRRSA